MKGFSRDPRVLVFAGALGVRALYLLTAQGPAFENPIIDADYYDALAVDLSQGRGLPPGPFWQPPLYPVLLAGLYSVFGHSLWAPRVLQMCLGALVAFLAADLAKRVSGKEGVAIAAGALVALQGPLVFYDGELLATSVAVFLGTLAVWLAMAASKSTQGVVASGVAVGLGALAVVPTLLLLIPVVYGVGGSWRRRGLVLVSCAAVILPVTMLNSSRSGEWIFISANGGVNLYLGNGPNIDRAMAIRPGAGWEQLMREPERAGITTPGGQDRYFAQRAVRFCIGHPGVCLKNFAWKARLLLLARELPRNESLEVVRQQSPVLAALTLRVGPLSFPYGLLWPLAWMGGVALLIPRHNVRVDAGATDQKRAGKVIGLTVFVLCLPPVLFFVTGRYRAPLAPFLCVLAAFGGEALRRASGRRLGALVAAAVVALGFAVWPAHLAVDKIDFASEVDFAAGGRLARLGNDGAAVAAWQRAIARRPDYLEAHYNLGLALERLGRASEAVDVYDRLLARWPHMLEAKIRRVDALVKAGKRDAAERALREMLAEDPRSTTAMVGLARVLLKKKALVEARDLIDQAAMLMGSQNEEVVELRRTLENGNSPP